MANLSNINGYFNVTDTGLVNVVNGGLYVTKSSGDAIAGIISSGGNGRPYYLRSNTSGNFAIYDDTACLERLIIASGGDVTIPKTLNQGTHGAYAIKLQRSDGTYQPFAATSGNHLYFYNNDAAGNYFFRNAADSSTLLTIENGGNVGIGATSFASDHKLQIHNASGTYARFALTNSATGTGSADGLRFQMESLNSIIKNTENGFLGFGTNGRESDIRIDSSGNVGIKTTSPSTFANYTNVSIKGGSSGGNLDFHNSSGTRVAAIVSTSGSSLSIETNENAPIDFKSNGVQTLRINSSKFIGVFGNTNPTCPIDFGTTAPNRNRMIGTYVTGNLFTGIGMAASTAGIRLAGDGGADDLLDVGYYSTDGNYTWTSSAFFERGKLTLTSSTQDPYLIIDGSDANRDSGIKINAGSGNKIMVRLDVGNTMFFYDNKLNIAGNGKVGIGTTNPSAKLEVNGDFLATGVYETVYNDTSVAQQWYKFYEKSGNAGGDYLHFALLTKNNAEFMAEVRIFIPTYAGFSSGYGNLSNGQGAQVEIRMGGLNSQTNILQAIDEVANLANTSTLLQLYLRIDPAYSNTEVEVINYADATVQFNMSGSWTTTDPRTGLSTRSFPFYNGNTAFNNTLNITSDNEVGIGVGAQNPTTALEVRNDDGLGNGLHLIADFNRAGGTDAQLILGYFANGTNATGPVVYAANGFSLLFSTGSVERMRLNPNNQTMTLTANTATGTNYIQFNNNAGTAQGYVGFGSSGNNDLYIVQQSSSSNIQFQNNSITRMIITSSGDVGIGTVSPSVPLQVHGQQKWYTTNADGNELRGFFNPGGSGDDAEFSVYKADGATEGVVWRGAGNSYIRIDSTSLKFINFYYGISNVGQIVTGGSNVLYQSNSDYRLKENVVKMTGALDRVSELKPSRYNFISHPGEQVDGFMAHELQEVVPQAVSGQKDEMNEDGTPKYQGVDHSQIVPLLVGAIQELKQEIETLKTQINN